MSSIVLGTVTTKCTTNHRMMCRIRSGELTLITSTKLVTKSIHASLRRDGILSTLVPTKTKTKKSFSFFSSVYYSHEKIFEETESKREESKTVT